MWIMLVVFGFLGVLSFFDIRWKKIPGGLLLGGSIFALGYASYSLHFQRHTMAEYAAALVPGAVLLLLAFATGKIGYGDGWVMLLIGLLSGYRGSMTVLFISLFFAGIAGIVLLVLRKGSKKTAMPFIPFVTIAVLIVEVVGMGP